MRNEAAEAPPAVPQDALKEAIKEALADMVPTIRSTAGLKASEPTQPDQDDPEALIAQALISMQGNEANKLHQTTFDSPLCDRVPEKIRAKIINHEFIVLDVLLPDYHDTQSISWEASKGRMDVDVHFGEIKNHGF